MSRIHFLGLAFVLFSSLPGQEGGKAELLRLISKPQHDSVLLDAYNELCWPIYSYDNFDSSIYYGKKAIELAEKTGDDLRLCVAHRRVGITYINTGEIKKSLYHQELSFKLADKLNFDRGKYLALNNMGAAYLNSDLYNKALNYFHKSLRYIEGTADHANTARVYANCATIYRRMGDPQRSKEHFLKAYAHSQLSADTQLVIVTQCNLATACRNLKMLDSADHYLQLAKGLMREDFSTATKFTFYLNAGLLEVDRKNYKRALDLVQQARPFSSSLSDEVTVLINIADLHRALRHFDEALKNLERALEISKKHKLYDDLEYISQSMARLYYDKGDVAAEARSLKLHLAYKDTNEKMNRTQLMIKQQLEFDFEKQQLADSLKYEQKSKLKNLELQVAAEKLERASVIRYLLIAFLVVVALSLLFIFNRFLITRRQKKEIEAQKQLVEFKNREILDSINYAKRLQTAILPQLSDIKKELDFELLYMPKDIIGGDFYFFENHNDHIFLAICDCTGHGIPGALMSVVCHHALDKAIHEFNLVDPARVLEKARELVIDSLNADEQKIYDGMDCSLLVINQHTRLITFSGANNPLWLLQGETLTELRADKQPVGYTERAGQFTTTEVQAAQGDCLYLCTDGYADQFGGPSGKKYKTKALKEFIKSLATKDVSKQCALLAQNFLNWKGELEQVDDVAMAIIRVA